ncbi:hypothetical protein [Rhizobium sp.]
MTAASMVDGLLLSAEELIRLKAKSAAYRRRAVSAAYYGVFHGLAKLCVETLLPRGRTEEELIRVYRALDHGQLRTALGQSPLKDHPDLREIGLAVIFLQGERHRADYLPPDKGLFPVADVQQIIAQARLTTEKLKNLDPASRRMLATCLLFKERKS